MALGPIAVRNLARKSIGSRGNQLPTGRRHYGPRQHFSLLAGLIFYLIIFSHNELRLCLQSGEFAQP